MFCACYVSLILFVSSQEGCALARPVLLLCLVYAWGYPLHSRFFCLLFCLLLPLFAFFVSFYVFLSLGVTCHVWTFWGIRPMVLCALYTCRYSTSRWTSLLPPLQRYGIDGFIGHPVSYFVGTFGAASEGGLAAAAAAYSCCGRMQSDHARGRVACRHSYFLQHEPEGTLTPQLV